MREYRFMQKLRSQEHVELVCTGDSITQRCYHTHGKPGYAGLFYDRVREVFQTYDVFLYNTGRSGSSTADLLPRIDRDVIRFMPDFATVMIGMNDAVMGKKGLSGFRERLSEIVERITSAKIEMMLLTQNCLPPGLPEGSSAWVRDALPAYTDVVREVARAYALPLCDVYADFERRLKENYDAYWLLLDDPIHPNETGHVVIADLLCASVGLTK